MKIVRSNLKTILDSKGISIRQLAERTELHFETLRRMYNDDTKQYNKVMLAKICQELDIQIYDLLLLEERKNEPSL